MSLAKSAPHTYRNKVPLTHLKPKDRPREKLLHFGSATLDHADLLSIILGTGRGQGRDALFLAQQVIKEIGSIKALSHINVAQLCLIKGIGPAKASRIIAARELMKRVLSPSMQENNENQPIVDQSMEDHTSFVSFLLDQIRATWDMCTPLIIAINLSQITVNGNTQTCLDTAVTLSLSSSLNDEALYGRWLAKLMIEDPQGHWGIIALKPNEDLNHREQEGASCLAELAHQMNLSLDVILVASPNESWLLLEKER